jgi:hypothetical protein
VTVATAGRPGRGACGPPIRGEARHPGAQTGAFQALAAQGSICLRHAWGASFRRPQVAEAPALLPARDAPAGAGLLAHDAEGCGAGWRRCCWPLRQPTRLAPRDARCKRTTPPGARDQSAPVLLSASMTHAGVLLRPHGVPGPGIEVRGTGRRRRSWPLWQLLRQDACRVNTGAAPPRSGRQDGALPSVRTARPLPIAECPVAFGPGHPTGPREAAAPTRRTPLPAAFGHLQAGVQARRSQTAQSAPAHCNRVCPRLPPGSARPTPPGGGGRDAPASPSPPAHSCTHKFCARARNPMVGS